MQTLVTIPDLRETRADIEGRRLSVGFVPTMGALHEGHLSLVRRSKRENDITIVSIFVNPTQFGPNEDLNKYPRPFEADKRLLEGEEVDYLFAPEANEVYSGNPLLTMDIPSMTNHLCGAKRPGHFNGVLLVVSKLFILVRPHRAYFGKKDYQQLTVLQQMAEDLSMGIEVVGCEIVREENGLAMSSRNLYLSEENREVASGISKALMETKMQYEMGMERAETLLEFCVDRLEKSGISRIDYLELCDKITLLKMPQANNRSVLLAAVYINDTRLIDNLEF